MGDSERRQSADQDDDTLDRLMEEVLLSPPSEVAPMAANRLDDWLDPAVRVILEEARSGLDDRGTLFRIAEEWDLDPELVLAEAIAREIRRELGKRASRVADVEEQALAAGFYSTFQLVETYVKAIKVATRMKKAGRETATQAAFDVLSSFFMPGKQEIPDINLQSPFDASVSDSHRIADEIFKTKDDRINENDLALELAREHGCLVPSGDRRKVMDTIRAYAKKYRSDSSHVDRMVRLEEEVRKLVRKRIKTAQRAR